MLIIDTRMRNFEKEKLKNLGYNLFEIKYNQNLYYEISSHVDIHCCKIHDILICDSNINIENSLKGSSTLKKNYPFDIAYNCCVFGKFCVHNFKYTDLKILEIIEKFNFKKIHINQGYSKCSIAVIDDNSVIVTDKKIANTLEKENINVLLLDEYILSNIFLLKNSNMNYSSLNGFIGGCISRFDDYIFISGDLNKIDYHNKIRNFILERNLKIIDFPSKDIIDYGGIVKFH